MADLDNQEQLLEQEAGVTVDDVIEIINKTIGHPMYAWVVPGFLWFHNLYRVNGAVIVAGIFAMIVDLCHLLVYLNQSYISGGNGEPINREKDVILITGASFGLGRTMSAILAQNGFQVINADIEPPEFDLPGVKYFNCDVSDFEQVEKLKGNIAKFLKEAAAREGKVDQESSQGHVTVLINNAGILTGNDKLVDTSKEAIEKSVNVNLLGQFWTIKTFLPDMLKDKRGYIVTVASALGYIGPGRASAYSASKAGLINMHDSLRHELDHDIQMLLVTPGQLDTRMFQGVKTPSKVIAPVVPVAYIAKDIVDALKKGRGGHLASPAYAKLLPWTQIVPTSILDIIRRAYGMDIAMEGLRQKDGNKQVEERKRR